MMFYKIFVSMLLTEMVVGAIPRGNATMHEETSKDPPQTIQGGKVLSKTDRNKRLFLVNVGHDDGGTDIFSCGGSLISPHAVLTAAHCLFDDNGNFTPPQWVDFYRYSKKDNTGYVRISLDPDGCISHDHYDPFTLDNDVAVLILPTAAPANIEPIKLNSDQSIPETTGVPLDVAGWGWLNEDPHPPNDQSYIDTDIPYVVTLDYVTTSDCTQDPYKYDIEEITEAMMCATALGKAPCHGDSGAPLVLGKGGIRGGMLNPVVQIGIVSHHGPGECELIGYPSVFTRVSDVWGWITHTVCQSKEELCPTFRRRRCWNA